MAHLGLRAEYVRAAWSSLRRRWRLAPLVALAAGAACSGGAPSLAPTGVQPGAVSPLASVPLLAGPTGYNPAPRVLVALPSASPVSMLLDTGSTGLRVLPPALARVPKSSYTLTAQHTGAVFGDDRVVYGTIAVANAGIVIGGSLRIEKSIAFQAIDKICAGVPATVPDVPPADCVNITPEYERDLIGGTIGVRPMTTGPLLSPLAELPSPYSNGFVVSAYGSAPELTVGATIHDQTGFELYQVGAATALDGSPGWAGNEYLPWCYAVTVPGSAAVSGCPSGGALTDSGGLNEHVVLPVAPPAGLAPYALATLPPNSTVIATLTSANATLPSITWTLATGTCTYYNAPELDFSPPGPAPGPSMKPSSNAIEPFFSNDVLYDLRDGTFGFRPVQAAPPAFCA